jgi:hypothetical protein
VFVNNNSNRNLLLNECNNIKKYYKESFAFAPHWQLITDIILHFSCSLCGIAKFGGQSIFDVEEELVLEGFILGINWQCGQFPRGNVDIHNDYRRVVLSLIRCKCCWSSLRWVEGLWSESTLLLSLDHELWPWASAIYRLFRGVVQDRSKRYMSSSYQLRLWFLGKSWDLTCMHKS